MNLRCKLWDCKYVYNFNSIPNKAICIKCKRKIELNLKTLQWEFVEKFKTTYNLGTDDELIERWR
jgi:hypothetical protein